MMGLLTSFFGLAVAGKLVGDGLKMSSEVLKNPFGK
jgi:hypothetical protein